MHIKTILITNIILTSSILMTNSLLDSLLVFITGLIALICFFNFKKLKNYFSLLYRFKTLFIAILLVQLLLRRTGDTYFDFPIQAGEWFNFSIKVTDIGVYFAFNSLLRYFVILLSATMLSSSSPYEMIKALRTWRLPETIIIMVSFTIQLLRQLQNDFKNLTNNLKKRNITFKKKSLKKRFELTTQLIVPIIGRLFSDIKYKVIALEMNGYGVNKKIVHFKYNKCKLIDYAFIGVYLSLICLIMFI